MEKSGTHKLAALGEYASVEVSDDERSIVHIHFMNTSTRMCIGQFERYILMLNEAMMKLNKNSEYYYNIQTLFKFYREMKNLDLLSNKGKLN